MRGRASSSPRSKSRTCCVPPNAIGTGRSGSSLWRPAPGSPCCSGCAGRHPRIREATWTWRPRPSASRGPCREHLWRFATNMGTGWSRRPRRGAPRGQSRWRRSRASTCGGSGLSRQRTGFERARSGPTIMVISSSVKQTVARSLAPTGPATSSVRSACPRSAFTTSATRLDVLGSAEGASRGHYGCAGSCQCQHHAGDLHPGGSRPGARGCGRDGPGPGQRAVSGRVHSRGPAQRKRSVSNLWRARHRPGPP
jgi:hypothetical protein